MIELNFQVLLWVYVVLNYWLFHPLVIKPSTILVLDFGGYSYHGATWFGRFIVRDSSNFVGIVSVFAFSSFWGIREMFEQRERYVGLVSQTKLSRREECIVTIIHT